MTPERLLSLHAASPSATARHLSTLPPAAVSSLISSLHTHPGLVEPLWTSPQLRPLLLSLTPSPPSLVALLESLTRAARRRAARLRTVTTAATAVLRARNYALLPPLIRALAALPDTVPLRVRLLRVFLSLAPLTTPLPPLLDLPVPASQHQPLVGFLHRALAAAPDHAAVLPHLLASRLPLAKPLLVVLARATAATLTALLAALHDDPLLAPRLAHLLATSITTAATPVTSPLLHSLFLLLSAGHEPTAVKIAALLATLLAPRSNVRFAPVAGVSDPARAVFLAAVRRLPPGVEQHLTQFLEACLCAPAGEPAGVLLEEVFLWHPSARPRVLKAVVAGLSTPASRGVHARLLGLLQNLCARPATAVGVRACAEELCHALDRAFDMPLGVDAAVVEAAVKVLVAVPAARDRAMVFLRKLAGGRGHRERLVACRGLIAVLAVDAGEAVHADAVDMLVVLSDGGVREHVVGDLLDRLQRSVVEARRVGRVVDAIVGRVRMVEGGGGMDLCRYFEPLGEEFLLRDPVPLMLRFCIVAHGGELGPFLGRFVKYLSDEQGAIKHACAAKRSPVPVVQRMTFLCDLLETVIGLGVVGCDDGIVRVCGAAIVLKDVFAASSGPDEKGRQASWHRREEDECLTMRQAAAANHVGGSLNDCKQGEVLSLLALRIQALSAIEMSDACKVPALVNMVRSEIFVHVETDVRSVLALKDVAISSTHVANLLSFVRKFFIISSPWTPPDRSAEGADTAAGLKKCDDPSTAPDNSSNGDALAFVSALGLDKDSLSTFEESNLAKLQEETRIRMRQSSLSILCALLSRKLVQDDVTFLMGLTEGEPAIEEDRSKTDDGTMGRTSIRATSTSPCVDNREDERVLVVSRLANLFHREFANSLSISLTLSYLALLGHLVSKECKRSEDTKKVRNFVSNTLTSLLREYSIRHQSVMRSILKLLTSTFESATGIDFAKAVLVWLGNSPCLLNSKFVETDEGSDLKLGVDEFDRDILEEAIALDAGEESEEETTSDLLNNDSPVGEPMSNVIGHSTGRDNGDNDCLESTPRIASDNADPVKSLCLDETPVVALMSVTSMLAFCELMLRRDTQIYREALKSASGNSSPAEEVCAERVRDVVKVFCETPFMQSFSSKSEEIPALLLKRLSGVVHIFLEIAQLVLQLLLKIFRNKAKAMLSKPHLRAVSSILNIFYNGDTSEEILAAALRCEQRSKRSSLQEAVNVSAAELFRYVSSKDCNLDEATQASVSKLRKILKSRKNRLLHVQSVKTPWTQSSGGMEPVTGDYFRVSRPQKRQRLRSRNPDVDEWLREEKDGDNYADLEDFVVAMDADQL